MSDQNKATLLAFFKALGQGDAAGLAEVLHPGLTAIATGTCILSGSRNYAEVIGTAGLLKQMAPEGIHFTPITLTAEDNRVSAEVEGRSTLVNGTPYNNQYHFLATFQDGKIVLLKEYFCTKLADAALGPLVAQLSQ